MAAAGCAARTAVVPPSAAVLDDRGGELMRRGCYRCLELAYDRAESRGAREEAFEAAALLALRSKELGLPSDVWFERARTLGGADPARSPYLEMVDVIPPDRLSENRDALFDIGRRNRARGSLERWREQLRVGAGSEAFRTYLDVSLICAFGTLKETADSFTGAVAPVASTALFQYALGACDATHRAHLTALRTSRPDFVDADYPLGRYALEDPLSPAPRRRCGYSSPRRTRSLARRQSRRASGTSTACGRNGNLHSSPTTRRFTSRPITRRRRLAEPSACRASSGLTRQSRRRPASSIKASGCWEKRITGGGGITCG